MLCTVIKNPLLSLFRVNGREILLVSLSLYSNVAKVQIAAHHLKGVGIERLILFKTFGNLECLLLVEIPRVVVVG